MIRSAILIQYTRVTDGIGVVFTALSVASRRSRVKNALAPIGSESRRGSCWCPLITCCVKAAAWGVVSPVARCLPAVAMPLGQFFLYPPLPVVG